MHLAAFWYERYAVSDQALATALRIEGLQVRIAARSDKEVVGARLKSTTQQLRSSAKERAAELLGQNGCRYNSFCYYSYHYSTYCFSLLL